MSIFAINYPHPHGCFDTLHIEESGVIWVRGWHRSHSLQDIELPICYINNLEIKVAQVFRIYRPDVIKAIKSDYAYHGFTCLYILPQSLWNIPITFELHWARQVIYRQNTLIQVTAPHYPALLDTTEVLHREHIYSSGPPIPVVATEVMALTSLLSPPILDFGCGSGAFVRALREHGLEAYGIEIDRLEIRQSLPDKIPDYIHLYDGSLPLPFENGAFCSAVAIEVIEHVPNYEQTLSEIARVVTDSFIITVPDISAIPLGHHNSVVPWHLLESTHVNFFTQPSLEKVLKKYFSQVEFARINQHSTNNAIWFTNLVAFCQK